MADDDLRRQLERLTERIERIESRLQLGAPPAPAPPPPATPVVPVAPPTTPSPLATTLKEQRDAALPGVTTTPQAPSSPGSPPRAVSPARPSAPPDVPHAPPPITKRPKTASSPLELIIGGKLAAWVGALVIVAGTALLVQLGIQSGWWGGLSPVIRCLVVALFGGALLAAGEIALRKISRAASVGLYGAGLGVLFLDAFAAFKHYEILSVEWSFVLMAITTAVGFMLTLRTRFLTIGVLAIVAGYATPALLSTGGGHDLEVLCYLTALLAGGLGLSLVKPDPFGKLRWWALGGHLIMGAAWLIGRGQSHHLMAIVFLSGWWCMVLFETVTTALKGRSFRGNCLAVVLATFAFVTGGVWILGDVVVGIDWRGPFTLAVGVLAGAAAMHFGPGVDGLRRRPLVPMDALACTLWAATGVLLVVAAALQFKGYGAAVSWFALALAGIEIGRRLPARSVDVFGIVVGALALGRVWLYDSWRGAPLRTTMFSTDHVTFTGWTLLALISIAVTIAVAIRLRTTGVKPWRSLPVTTMALAFVAWFTLWRVCADATAVTLFWLAAVVAGLALHVWGERQKLFGISLVALLATALHWIGADAITTRLTDAGLESLPFLNGQMATAALIVAVSAVAAVLLGRRVGTVDIRWVLAVIGGVVLTLVAISFEVDRVVGRLARGEGLLATYDRDLLRGLFLTAVWGLGGLGLIAAGWLRSVPALVRTGWVFAIGATFAWLTYDTLGWRIFEGLVEAPVIFNLQCGVGVILAGVLFGAWWLGRDREEADPRFLTSPVHTHAFGLGLFAVVLLWLGSFEIDRLFGTGTRAGLATLSVYWAVFAVGLIVVGFRWRQALARYAGLGLLAVTVVKVVVVDLATVESTWRVISFLASGLLLVGTSVLYTRLSPRLLADTSPPGPIARDARAEPGASP